MMSMGISYLPGQMVHDGKEEVEVRPGGQPRRWKGAHSAAEGTMLRVRGGRVIKVNIVEGFTRPAGVR